MSCSVSFEYSKSRKRFSSGEALRDNGRGATARWFLSIRELDEQLKTDRCRESFEADRLNVGQLRSFDDREMAMRTNGIENYSSTPSGKPGRNRRKRSCHTS